jgi:hypothetical protein
MIYPMRYMRQIMLFLKFAEELTLLRSIPLQAEHIQIQIAYSWALLSNEENLCGKSFIGFV